MATSNVLERFSIANKTVIITGGTGGIGREMAVALAEAGADIVSLELPGDPLAAGLLDAIKPTGRELSAFSCNIRDQASIEAAFNAIWKAGIVPDILVNAAGITRHMTIEDTGVADLDAVMSINYRGTYLVTQQFGRKLLESNRRGKIINFGSMAAQLVQTNISVYSSSKAAIQALTRAISNEWAGKGITCNAICPGQVVHQFIRTGMCTDLFNDREFERKIEQRTSLGRWGQADDLKGLMVFLASPASDFLTGESIVIDGGVIGR